MPSQSVNASPDPQSFDGRTSSFDEMDTECMESDPSVLALASFDPTRLDELIAAAARGVWSVAALRPRQRLAVHALFNPGRPNHLVVAERTGGGKTLMMKLMGVMEGGIVAIIVPLHTLTADVLKKFVGANQAWGTVQALHLDELYDNARGKYLQLLDTIRETSADTTTTRFVAMSPHHLVHHRNALDAILAASRNGALRLVIIDEVHLHVQQGASFRIELRMLRELFFREHFHGPRANRHNKLVLFTATLANE